MVGVILISKKGAAGATGRPKDVDREFVTLFMMFHCHIDEHMQAGMMARYQVE